jgi:outer membrane protein insertion porin family
MKVRSHRLTRILAVLVVCLQMVAQTQAQELLSSEVRRVEISHVGPPPVSDEYILSNLRVKEGEPFMRMSVDEDVRKLYNTGFFYNIRVLEEPSAAGLTLKYILQGNPVITEIRFTGNDKFSARRLRRKVTSKVGEPMSERRLFNDAQEILKVYQKSGLQKTRVDYRPSINAELGRATVTFEIVEAPKIKVEDVEFVGAEEIKQRKLRRAIKTRRWWVFSWLTSGGRLKDDVLDEDRDRLRDFYAERGYIDFDLKGVEIEPQRNTNKVNVRWVIEEGQQYQIGAVRFEGNELFSQDEIVSQLRSSDGQVVRPGLQLAEGETFTPKGLMRDVEAIEDFYGAKGYIEARAFPQKVANVETGTLDLVYLITEGDKFYVERVDIQGNTKTKDKVIRRELAVFPGETFDMVRVKLSRSRLEQMQYFERVEAQPENTQIENRKNLVINVEEKNTGNVQLGAGFSSIDALVGFAEVSQGNFDLFNPPYFTGGGQKARLRVQAGTRRQDYMLTFIEPWFLGRRLSLSTDLYHRDLRFLSDNYSQRQTGARIGLTRQLPYNFIAGVNYTIESIDLSLSDNFQRQFPNSVVLQEQGERLVSRLGASITHDTRNSVILPTRGHRVELTGDIAGGPLGGDVDYYRLELRASQFYTPQGLFSQTSVWQDILEGHVLELTGRAGVIEAYGDGDRGVEGRVPLFDRWYMGGLYSLRGYRFREVGPRDPVSFEPLGGGTYWFGGAEYSVPIIERLRFAVFYDIGMVYPDAYSFDPQDFIDSNGTRQTTHMYNDNWGVGLRLNLPIGPLRLDYGIPITRDTRLGSSGRFQFGVGYTRDF